MLVVGPSKLPPDGDVRVWMDTGSGPGYEFAVPVKDLGVVNDDQADDRGRVYSLTERECDG
ncbi:hypothetical protein AB0M02_13400 [Actinoplanes sp. NPDC051861]|uniref:hypothetical protein n=1 Tax=Actinoplanes sp. NPDC051861 TaxID=3155170 RepID=UPI00343957F0